MRLEVFFFFQITISPETLWLSPFIFGDFTDLNAPSSTRIYRQLPSYGMLSTMLEEYYMRTRYFRTIFCLHYLVFGVGVF